jgi:hypothetical protein
MASPAPSVITALFDDIPIRSRKRNVHHGRQQPDARGSTALSMINVPQRKTVAIECCTSRSDDILPLQLLLDAEDVVAMEIALATRTIQAVAQSDHPFGDSVWSRRHRVQEVQNMVKDVAESFDTLYQISNQQKSVIDTAAAQVQSAKICAQDSEHNIQQASLYSWKLDSVVGGVIGAAIGGPVGAALGLCCGVSIGLVAGILGIGGALAGALFARSSDADTSIQSTRLQQ